jgi:5-methylcytosine-specific restriction protein A
LVTGAEADRDVLAEWRMMARKEFTVRVKRQVVLRSLGICERSRWKAGEECTKPAKAFDHIVADGLGGEPTVDNCAHLCQVCHDEKTHSEDNPRMRKADAQFKAANGIKTARRPIKSRGFSEPKPKREKTPLPPRRSIYGDVT